MHPTRLLLLPVLLAAIACSGGDAGPVGGAALITITDADGANVDPNPVPATWVAAERFDSQLAVRLVVRGVEREPDRTTTSVWELEAGLGSEPIAGRAYSAHGGDLSLPADGIILRYSQYNRPGELHFWRANAGAVTVESRSGSTATLAVRDVRFQIDGAEPDNRATGEFILNAELTIDDLDPEYID